MTDFQLLLGISDIRVRGKLLFGGRWDVGVCFLQPFPLLRRAFLPVLLACLGGIDYLCAVFGAGERLRRSLVRRMLPDLFYRFYPRIYAHVLYIAYRYFHGGLFRGPLRGHASHLCRRGHAGA